MRLRTARGQVCFIGYGVVSEGAASGHDIAERLVIKTHTLSRGLRRNNVIRQQQCQIVFELAEFHNGLTVSANTSKHN